MYFTVQYIHYMFMKAQLVTTIASLLSSHDHFPEEQTSQLDFSFGFLLFVTTSPINVARE